MTPDGLENPTLHVNPGDTLTITVTNNTPFNDAQDFDEPFNFPTCGDTTFEKQNAATNNGMTGGSMNIHYHGTNTSPHCQGIKRPGRVVIVLFVLVDLGLRHFNRILHQKPGDPFVAKRTGH